MDHDDHKHSTANGWKLICFVIVIAFVPIGTSTQCSAALLYFDDFEGGLLQWVGKDGGSHHGVIVDDPIRPGNHVLTFTELNEKGDIFGSEMTVTPGKMYTLSFEYLGVPDGGEPGDLGGFIGFSEDTPGEHRWLAGRVVRGGAEDVPLIGDGQWRSYTIEFDPFAPGPPGAGSYSGNPSNNTIRVMLEDWEHSGGVPGDAYFDSISVVPEPSTLLIAALGLLGLVGCGLRRTSIRVNEALCSGVLQNALVR